MKKIIFMGTSEFAVPSLENLIENGFDVKLVVTRSDKPSGSKKEIKKSNVKLFAEKNNLNIFQPENLKDKYCYDKLKRINPDFIVVASYGKILDKNILDIPKIAPINVHGSLLPLWRGPSPIQYSILNNDVKTGVTIMVIDQGIDTGDILSQEETNIIENENSYDLMQRLSIIGSNLLIKVIKNIKNKVDLDKIRIKQDENKATYTSIIKKEDAFINWDKPAICINNLVKSMNPWPVAFFYINNKKIKIYKSKIIKNFNKKLIKPGEFLSTSPFIISCQGVDSIEIIEVQLEGKKRMPAADFIRGYKINLISKK